jgi:arabinose-5-phosphate isomerase
MGDDLLRANVEIVMNRQPKTIRPQALAAEALGSMNQHKITSLFAVDAEHRPLGILHIHDCLRAGIA